MGEKTSQELSKIIGNLEFSFIDFFLRSRGNITRWKKCSSNFTNFQDFTASVGTTFFFIYLEKKFSIKCIWAICGYDRVMQ